MPEPELPTGESAQRWWQFTLREILAALTAVSVYCACARYFGPYVVFYACIAAIAAVALFGKSERPMLRTRLLRILFILVLLQFSLLTVPWFGKEARRAWGIDTPRFGAMATATVLNVIMPVAIAIFATRPSVVIRNDLGERLERLSVCVYSDDALVMKREWTEVADRSYRTVWPPYFSGRLVVEFGGRGRNCRREAMFSLGRAGSCVVEIKDYAPEPHAL